MKYTVEATWILPTYQEIGPVVRVHWGHRTEDREDMDGTVTTFHIFWEAVCPIDGTREEWEGILQSHPHIEDNLETLLNGWNFQN